MPWEEEEQGGERLKRKGVFRGGSGGAGGGPSLPLLHTSRHFPIVSVVIFKVFTSIVINKTPNRIIQHARLLTHLAHLLAEPASILEHKQLHQGRRPENPRYVSGRACRLPFFRRQHNEDVGRLR